MDLIEGKEKSKEYYDQVPHTYKQMYEDNYDKYPANLIRLKLLIRKLKEKNTKTVLDVGCGTCAPMIKLLKEGFVDIYRSIEPNTTDSCYTWWSQRGQAYNKNVGWRIDYQISTENLAKYATKAEIYKGQRFSDHAPLVIDYDVDLKTLY